jgi:hypothetical protein
MILGDKRLLCLILLLASCAVFTIKLSYSTFSLITYDFDPLLHDVVCQDLKTVIAADLQQKKSLCTYCKELKARFLFIASVCMSRISLHQLHVSIRANAPICFINDKYTLLDNRRLVPKTVFNAALRNLPIISMPTITEQTAQARENSVDEHIIHWIRAQENAILQRTTVCIYASNNILVTAKDTGHQLLCTWQQKIDEQCLATTLKFLEDAKASANKKNSLIADIRFTGQIVLHNKKNGKGAV